MEAHSAPSCAIPDPAFCPSRVRTTHEGIRVTAGAGQVELTVNHAWLPEPLELIYTPAEAMRMSDKLREAAGPWMKSADVPSLVRIKLTDSSYAEVESNGGIIDLRIVRNGNGMTGYMSLDQADALGRDLIARAAAMKAGSK